MHIKFSWDGDPTSQLDVQDIKDGIKTDLEEYFSDLISQSSTVYLTNDILKSVISGVVIGADGKHILKVTRRPYENKTDYEQI